MNFSKVLVHTWIRAVLYAAALGILYSSALSWLILHDWPREDYSYAWFMPPLVAYLVWIKRDQFLQTASVPSWYGLCAFIPGIIGYWAGELSGEFFSQYISLWLVVAGLAWMNLGWKKLKVLTFPVVFSLFMFPLPNFLNTQISVKLKLISSWIGVRLMQVYGLSAYREGNIIDLGFTRLQVVDACSGFRYLIPLIVLGVLFAYFYRGVFWKKVILVLSTIPISIITNSLRIALTGILFEIWGPKAAEGFFHDFSGWFIFMVSFGLFLLEMQLLRLLPPHHAEKPQEDLKKKPFPDESLESPHPEQPWTGFFRPMQFITALIVLCLTLGLSHGMEFREKTPMVKSFREFPMNIGHWQGIRGTMEQKIIDTLDLSDYIIADYTDEEKKTVNFYVAYYESQRKGESIHSPATCLPGSGWVFNSSGTHELPIAGPAGEPMRVNRVIMQKGDMRQLVYYWFHQRNRVLTNAYQLKIFNFLDALIRHRTDGALVRIITPVYKSEDFSDAENRMLDFTSSTVPVLNGFLPQ